MRNVYRNVAGLIRNQSFDEARAELNTYLQSHPADADAWYLMSLAETDKKQQVKALRTALKHQPEHHKARQRLAQLEGQPTHYSRWLLVLGGSVVMVALVLGVLLYPRFTTEGMPTLAVFNTATPQADMALSDVPMTDAPLSDVALSDVPLSDVALSDVRLHVPTATQTAQPADSAAVGDETRVASVPPTQVAPGMLPSLSPDVQSVSQPAATFTAKAATVIVPTNTEVAELTTRAATASAQPTQRNATRPAATQPTLPPTVTAPPSATWSAADLVPLGSALQIGTGEMRLIASTIPANDYIRTLGSGIPPIQANQQWVVLEVLIICNASINCSPTVTSFQLVTNSTAYAPTPLSVESALGDGTVTGGQVWGHLAFVIPANEPVAFLRLQSSNQEFHFAVQ